MEEKEVVGAQEAYYYEGLEYLGRDLQRAGKVIQETAAALRTRTTNDREAIKEGLSLIASNLDSLGRKEESGQRVFGFLYEMRVGS